MRPPVRAEVVGARDQQERLQHERVREVDAERTGRARRAELPQRRTPVAPQQPRAEQRPAEGERLEDDDRLEDGARVVRRRAEDLDLDQVDADARGHAGGRHERDPPPAAQVPPGEGAQLLEVPARERARHHVQDVGVDPVALPGAVQELRDEPVTLPPDPVVQPDGQPRLVGERDAEQPGVVSLGLLQHPPDQREQQVDLHADEQEVQVVARAGVLQVMQERGREGAAGPPVGRVVDRGPGDVGGQDEPEPPPQEPAGLERPAPVVVRQHQRREQEEQLAAGVEDGGDRADAHGDVPAGEGQRVHAHHEHHDDQPDQVERDDVRPRTRASRASGS